MRKAREGLADAVFHELQL